MGKKLVGGGMRTYKALLIKFAVLCGHGLWCPETIMIVTSNITDHRSQYKYNNNEKNRNIVRITKT